MNETGGAGFKKRGSQRISGFLSAACAAVTVIPLDVRLPARSSHLPASSVGHVNACLFGVAPGGGCRVSPRRFPRQQADTVAADSSLWPCSSPHGGRSLAVTLPYGARTFLYWSDERSNSDCLANSRANFNTRHNAALPADFPSL